MFPYDEVTEKAAKILDKHDFTDYLGFCKVLKKTDPYDIKEYLKNTYCGEVAEALEELSTDEFMEYLFIKYGITFTEVINYKMNL